MSEQNQNWQDTQAFVFNINNEIELTEILADYRYDLTSTECKG